MRHDTAGAMIADAYAGRPIGGEKRARIDRRRGVIPAGPIPAGRRGAYARAVRRMRAIRGPA
jgi:hypothetical protein